MELLTLEIKNESVVYKWRKVAHLELNAKSLNHIIVSRWCITEVFASRQSVCPNCKVVPLLLVRWFVILR